MFIRKFINAFWKNKIFEIKLRKMSQKQSGAANQTKQSSPLKTRIKQKNKK